MKLILVSPKNRTVYNFRGDLIRKLQASGFEVVVTGPNRDDVQKVEALGVRFIEVPMAKNGTNPFADLSYKNRLKKIFREEKPDIVLGYTIKPVIYGTWAAKSAGVKNINAMITGVGYTFLAKSKKAKILRWLVFKLYRHSLKKATHVIYQNKDDLALFVKHKLVNVKKCSIVNGSGVNITHFTPQPLPEGAPCFFMLSRLLKSKGVMEYLEAARLTKEKYPEATFTILGKYETAMQDAVARDVVEKYINDGIVTKYDETDDVRPYYGKCSVYVLPSYGEGTPRTVLEAMASARPIITSDANGCRETVVDGENGFLVPVKDAKSLKDKMCYFIEHPEKIKSMGAASRAICEEKYAVEKVNHTLFEIMEIQ
ncbi:MAG: glycosyltransferase family 4 protein [Ruminococcaceae bacterium]|nr:glycosyltransferase family 4 protein [Oscillospiraceae bacterium]